MTPTAEQQTACSERFHGILEVRKQGAIGIFEKKDFWVMAVSFNRARAYIMDDAHDLGYETRNFISLSEVSKEEYNRATDT